MDAFLHFIASNLYFLGQKLGQKYPEIAPSNLWYVQVAAKSRGSVLHALAWIAFLPGHASA
ncbi:uncharacterized protein DS421_20g695540 [Arachis hypogaea]|nr:uncharacterized protein DS421_20g695540 [Arachis hypogaea]